MSGARRAFRTARRACRAAAGTIAAALAVFGLLAGPAHAQPERAPALNEAGTPPAAPASTAAAAAMPLPALLEEARRLLDGGESRRALELLESRESVYAGDPDFDYLLGLAALDAGRPGQAVLALERVLVVRPDFLQARAEIARAYFALRENEAARREFETVSAQRIPEQARAIVGRYLDAIQRAESATQPRVTAALEAEAGYDSNVNFGSSAGQWILGDGTAVVPLPASQPRPSAFFGVAGGINRIAPMGGGWQWTIGGRAQLRVNPSVHTLDQGTVDLSTGLTYRTRCHQVSMAAQAQHLRLDDSAFRNAMGGVVQWQCDLDARSQVGLYAQGFDLDFPIEPLRDARRMAAGATFARLLDGAGDPIVVGSVHGGRETSREGYDFLTYGFAGLRVALSAAVGGGWRASASLFWEARDFAGPEPLFGIVREDRQTELRAMAEKRLDRNWLVAPQVTFTSNRSTVGPNDFRRVQASLIAQYRF